MRAADIIVKKRSGAALSREEIRHLVKGYVQGDIPDYQMAAWLMAVYFQGMGPQETAELTRAMIDSGDVFGLDSLAGPLVDKHSTGGVGDKISLILAPLAAACGLQVPMMSGRGLGHTGGTLDKLESIPGYSTALDEAGVLRGLEETGFIMTGQSATMVPADRLMYALRDVTGTVESIPLITASILSKKFAEGARSLVMDVKVGRGAFMKTLDEARALARSLVDTAAGLDRSVVAVLSNMDVPLGRMIGNFLEVEESVEVLQGRGPGDVRDLSLELCAWMLKAGGLEKDLERARQKATEALDSGAALVKFQENVAFQGGDWLALEKQLGQRRAYYSQSLKAESGGWVQDLDALELGLCAVDLGAGRARKEDSILPNVGIELEKKPGDRVEAQEVLARVWADDEQSLERALHRIRKAWTLTEQPPAAGQTKPLVLEVLGHGEVQF